MVREKALQAGMIRQETGVIDEGWIRGQLLCDGGVTVQIAVEFLEVFCRLGHRRGTHRGDDDRCQCSQFEVHQNLLPPTSAPSIESRTLRYALHALTFREPSKYNASR